MKKLNQRNKAGWASDAEPVQDLILNRSKKKTIKAGSRFNPEPRRKSNDHVI